ncbi:MAG: NAD(P)-dependent oxidoreductase, partial [Chloroflexota bacterium]|nr:NAD(P)-dependent oxidoreductase [Chloroflexota bacterium]
MTDAKDGRIGFIGLGIMGKPMVRNLSKAGFKLTVHNRTRASAEQLAGEIDDLAIVDSPAEVAAACDVIITMLPDSPDVEQVAFGENGLVDAMRPGSLLIDMSTIAPATSIRVNEELKARGASALDAPVSGGDKGAIAGTLSIMVGGSDADLQRAMPLFEAMGKTIVHLGGPGAGQIAKAC